MYKLLLILTVLIFSKTPMASVITVELEDKEFKFTPANDLIYDYKKINTHKAIELAKGGIDLSTLNPESSTLFNADEVKYQEQVEVDTGQINYHSALSAPTEFFRASVTIDGQNFTISASLYNHDTLLRAALLQAIGYKVTIPKYLPEFSLNFESLAEKDIFLESLTQSTLLARAKWAPKLEEEKNELKLTLKGFLLESADIKTVPVYWPVMDQSRQKDRRVFRSLLYLYSLTDFSSPINDISWNLGQIFDNKLNLAHSYASAFLNVTINDLKWMHRKISNLTESELSESLKYSNYPYEIEKLLFEKLKSRINTIGRILELPSDYAVDKKVTILGVQNGKLLSSKYPQYVPTFWKEDPESPFRFSEIFRLLRSQVVYNSLSGLLDTAVEKFIPNITTTEAASNIQKEIKEFGQKNGAVNLSLWAYPTVQGSAFGRRSIVFGQFQGSNAPIQLVDQVGFKFKAGVLGILAFPTNAALVSMLFNAGVQRSWTHSRPMPDIKTATKEKLSKLLVPNLMKKLGRVIGGSTECTLKQKAWHSEEIITTFRTWVIYHDKDDDKAKEHALALREELIAKGIDENKIIFSAVSKSVLCEKEINDTINKNVEDFLKEFALEETITVADSLSLNTGVALKYDVSYIDKLKAQLSYARSRIILRSYIIRKTEHGLEVNIQNQHDKSHELSQELKFIISFFNNSNKWLTGQMENKIYKIKLVNVTKEEKIAAINTLRQIFLHNSFDALTETYNPIALDHKAKVKQRTTNFFWKKWEMLSMAHEVEITVPNTAHNVEITDEEEETVWSAPIPDRVDLTEDQRKRSFYSVLDIKRKGKNYHRTLDELVQELTFSWLSLGSSNENPGRSFYGVSEQESFITESELTESEELRPTTKIEYSKVGWKASVRLLNQYLDKYEYYFNYPGSNFKIDRSIFNQTNSLQSYELKTTIVFYPSAMNRIEEKILNETNTQAVIEHLKAMYGPQRWANDCKNTKIRNYTIGNIKLSKIKFLRECVPKIAHYILRLRGNGFSKDKKSRTHQVNELYKNLFYFYKTPNILHWVGKDNFFSTTIVNGFMHNDSKGYLQYTSDSVGVYDEQYAAGLLNHISTLLGVTAYTVKAMNYTPGMGI